MTRGYIRYILIKEISLIVKIFEYQNIWVSKEKQRIDFARLEHVMHERTAALFDAREVSLDEDKNLYKKLKSLERVLDKHHYRFTELESKIS